MSIRVGLTGVEVLSQDKGNTSVGFAGVEVILREKAQTRVGFVYAQVITRVSTTPDPKVTGALAEVSIVPKPEGQIAWAGVQVLAPSLYDILPDYLDFGILANGIPDNISFSNAVTITGLPVGATMTLYAREGALFNLNGATTQVGTPNLPLPDDSSDDTLTTVPVLTTSVDVHAGDVVRLYWNVKNLWLGNIYVYTIIGTGEDAVEINVGQWQILAPTMAYEEPNNTLQGIDINWVEYTKEMQVDALILANNVGPATNTMFTLDSGYLLPQEYLETDAPTGTPYADPVALTDSATSKFETHDEMLTDSPTGKFITHEEMLTDSPTGKFETHEEMLTDSPVGKFETHEEMLTDTAPGSYTGPEPTLFSEVLLAHNVAPQKALRSHTPLYITQKINDLAKVDMLFNNIKPQAHADWYIGHYRIENGTLWYWNFHTKEMKFGQYVKWNPHVAAWKNWAQYKWDMSAEVNQVADVNYASQPVHEGPIPEAFFYAEPVFLWPPAGWSGFDLRSEYTTPYYNMFFIDLDPWLTEDKFLEVELGNEVLRDPFKPITFEAFKPTNITFELVDLPAFSTLDSRPTVSLLARTPPKKTWADFSLTAIKDWEGKGFGRNYLKLGGYPNQLAAHNAGATKAQGKPYFTYRQPEGTFSFIVEKDTDLVCIIQPTGLRIVAWLLGGG